MLPDFFIASLEQAGPIISYNKPLDKMIVDKSVPLSDGSIRWPSTASPIDTPAWGINASPKYLRISEEALVIMAPIVEPTYFPAIRTRK